MCNRKTEKFDFAIVLKILFPYPSEFYVLGKTMPIKSKS